MASPDHIRRDFDLIAGVAAEGASGRDRYDALLVSLVPEKATTILDIGSGLGRLAAALARPNRTILGVDLSPEMIKRARQLDIECEVTFLCGDFLTMHLDSRFDCIISSATLHHMPADVALPRMLSALAPGGRLIIHDLRVSSGPSDAIKLGIAMAHDVLRRVRRGRSALGSRRVRSAWNAHAVHDVYPTRDEVRAMAARHLRGPVRIIDHWLGRYTLVWDKPAD